MRNGKKWIAFLVAGAVAASGPATLPVSAYGGIPRKVTIVNAHERSISKKTVSVGEKFELEANVNRGAEDDYLTWKIISGKKVVRFVRNEKYGEDAELVAKKAGTAKVQVYAKGRHGKNVKDTITIKVKKASSSGGRIYAKEGETVEYEEAYDDFDLEVRKSKASIKESQLQWHIGDRNIVDFAGGRTTGHEVEFYAKQPGTTTVTCRYVVSGKEISSVTFTIHVTPY